MTRGIILLALHRIRGSTSFLVGVAQEAVLKASGDEALVTGLGQLRADLQNCVGAADGLIERLENTREAHTS